MAANLAEYPIFPAWADPTLPPRERLPTMYDLPSEEVGDPGMPDEFHVLQPSLLRETFRPPGIPPEQVFSAADMNLYYDPRHFGWYKRPDWFAVLGASRLYQQKDMRLSYVIWQEEIAPTVVLEMLSPGTEDEDLGEGPLRKYNEPPPKWDVYERILQVPLYIVYSRYTQKLRVFRLRAGRYLPLSVKERRCWLKEIGLGIGLWEGEHLFVPGTWLRWYDRDGHWIPTSTEQERERTNQERKRADQERKRADQERERADQERERADHLAQQLRALGIDPETLI
ncbi:Uma2 domain-containing protein [Gammaproteobacteria bacterium]